MDMEKTRIELEREVEAENPVFVEGLAGIGHIGRNTVSYIADQTEAEEIGEVSSHHFPPHTIVNDDKTVEPIKNKIYELKRDGRDIILLEGNAQAGTPEGHHEVAEKVMNFVEDIEAEEVITVGGYGTGDVVEDPEVFGAVSLEEMKEKYSDSGIQFEHEVGQIVGISGLLIGLAQDREMDGLCLLGETPGFLLSDPKSTEAVLQALEEILGLDLDYSKLDEKVEESQEVLKKLQNLKKSQKPDEEQQSSDLGYIG